jgi:hypothetical protein
MINITLSGISFLDLPYITNKSRDDFGQLVKGEEAIIVREEGKIWDSNARPAYAVRLEGCHIGYIPLIETVKEEYMQAKDGFRKVWKEPYEEMTKEELREASAELIRGGELPSFHEWWFVGTHTLKPMVKRLFDKCCYIEMVRDSLYTDFNFNHMQPTCTIQAVYYEEGVGRNYEEVGEVCSIVATFEGID